MDHYLPLILKMLDIKDELYSKGLITPFGGNISVRCPDNPNQVLITPGGIYKKNLIPDQIICLDFEGIVLNKTEFKSTSETPIHLTVMRNRPDINAVIHTHAPYATIVGLTGLEFKPITSDAVMLGELPIVEWTTTGTAESGKILSEAFAERRSFVIIRNHGLVAAGPTLEFASGVTTMVEDTCKELVICKQLGIEPRVLPKEKIEIIHNLMKKGSI